MKMCTKCGETKELSEFHKMCSASDGLQSRCKSCGRRDSRAYYRQNRERLLRYTHEYRLEHDTEIRLQRREYRAAHRGELADKNREYYWNNVEAVRARDRIRPRHPQAETQAQRHKKLQLATKAVATHTGPWTKSEDSTLRLLPIDVEAAFALGRTLSSVKHRRHRLREQGKL